jgi:hypothetical protein
MQRKTRLGDGRSAWIVTEDGTKAECGRKGRWARSGERRRGYGDDLDDLRGQAVRDIVESEIGQSRGELVLAFALASDEFPHEGFRFCALGDRY